MFINQLKKYNSTNKLEMINTTFEHLINILYFSGKNCRITFKY